MVAKPTEGMRRSSRKWYTANKAAVAAYNQIPEVKERKRAWNRAWLAKMSPAERKARTERSRILDRITPWRVLIVAAKARAAKKGLEFNLTIEWAISVYDGRCAVTGLPFLIYGGVGNGPLAFSPSIDRIRGERGYTTDNCRFVLHAVNSFKGQLDDDEMLELARRIVGVMGECFPRVDLEDRFCNIGRLGTTSPDDLLLAGREKAQRLLQQKGST